MIESRGVVVDWDCFKRVFLEKYFSDSVRYAKEAEFMRLQQGSMSVSDYAMRCGRPDHISRDCQMPPTPSGVPRGQSDGIVVDPAKVEAVIQWEHLRTVAEIRSFVGLTGYYQRFIEDFSRIVMPLT
ncbi:uncharacterized protein LOC109811732 [Cajanus cajan]|uniref:uncharacterized protein LOC109811732 n=1 Tax=Cajanus cajan TaxID=3821 RepID=UPI00098DCC77|nr:uncharacterized protein LOC109811732 [Cajanus cajan]